MFFDLHCDTFTKIIENEAANLRNNDFHVDLMKLKKSNYIGQCFAMFVDIKKNKNPFNYVNQMIDKYYSEINKNKDLIKPIFTTKDLITAKNKNLIASILCVEEGESIEGSLLNLETLYNKGVRMMTLTWNYPNKIGFPNSLGDNKNTSLGLTDFGIKVVKKMEELNMIIDVSHGSDKLVLDVLNNTTKAFIASHSNSSFVFNHKRNLSDELLKKMKDRNCLIGLNFCKAFVNSNKDKMYLDDLFKHIEHLREIIGINNIALGTDFDGISCELEIEDASKMGLLIDYLKKKNYSLEDIEKITYKNAYNFFLNNL